MGIEPIGVGVVGAGRWGRNYVRTLLSLPAVDLRWVCDIDPLARARVLCVAPAIQTVAELDCMLADPQVQAVVVATSAARHAACALAALAAGKHVLVEKPMALTVSDARELAARARSLRRTVLVGHVMLYHRAIEELCALAAEGALGAVEHVFARRTNADPITAEDGALWNLAPHDLSIVDALFGCEPVLAAARRPQRERDRSEDAVILELAFAGGASARIQVAEGAARRTRRLVVVGARRILVFDDCGAAAQARIYARDTSTSSSTRAVELPLAPVEPLRVQCEHFVECILGEAVPRSPAEHGLRVVRWLAAAERSLLLGGRPVEVADEEWTARQLSAGASRASAPG